ncbi:exported protein A EppA [Borreliella burgdorferi]|uniref:EppA n=1 Tax=Borreliella burgdorferi TaxID=139 RepID=Q840B5_BORBG|nr:exported protein A EppA [Borreliella burgdorferi]AAO33425.1 EppA [Borreliella burgdorferi]MCD2417187.1 exported protein A EppA [Borreliella burgdorferi]MCD2419424.1 exported protein A EppA [Borreliella burgdorferi]
MRKISLLLFLLSINLNAFWSEKNIEENYAKAKKSFSKEDFNLIKNRLDNYGFENEYDKSKFLSKHVPEIRGELRKIKIKENSVLLDALDIVGYLIKNKFIKFVLGNTFDWSINNLIEGYPGAIFDHLIQLDSDKIDYGEKYGEEAREKFRQSYKKDKITAVKQIFKQILADLPKD